MLDELLIDDPERLALRQAYRAILSWPIRKQTTSPGDLGGRTGEAAIEPQLKEQEQNDYIPETPNNTESTDMQDGAGQPSLEPSLSGPSQPGAASLTNGIDLTGAGIGAPGTQSQGH